MASLLSSMLAAAEAAAPILTSHFARVAELTVVEKGTSDFVSIADTASEGAIRKALASSHPGIPFQGEETTTDRVTSGPRFVFDPLDGTTNFLRGIPQFAISIAYCDDEGPAVAVTMDPCRGEVFTAERGKGAQLRTPNGARVLGPLPPRALDDAVVHTGVPHRGRGDHARYLVQLERVMARVNGVRRMGAAALDLAWVAAGRGDAFFELGLQPWDLAAGILLVREAGGVVTDFSGGDDMLTNTEVVAGAPRVHGELLALVR
jgi:myo-inositol-1(or 4)-monophosphatase